MASTCRQRATKSGRRGQRGRERSHHGADLDLPDPTSPVDPGTTSDGREKGRAKRPAVWVGAARPKTGQWTPHGVEERPAIGKSSIFMDEILMAEDGVHGRSLEDVKGRSEEWSWRHWREDVVSYL